MSDIHVTYDGDTYWLQCFSDDPSAEKGIIVDPIDVGDSWVTLAEKVAEHEAQHGCSPVDEDAPGNEPPKVIVVTEAPVGDRAPLERRYLAHEADDHDDYGFLGAGPVSAATPGQAERDYAEFIRWWEAKGYHDGQQVDFSDARDAFASGMRAARAAAQEPHAATELPKPAAGVDPASAAYRIEAHAFNAVTRALAPGMFVPLSERQAIAQAVVAAVEPIIRAAEREPHAAPELPQPAPELGGTVTIDGQTFPQATPAPELAAAMRETKAVLGLLDDFTRDVITYSPVLRIAKTAATVRKNAGLPPVEGK